ncbi:amidohydrolase (plasmid) [Agrobacterium tumefaciens]|nr:amidohydrolase [Agrobacterium tumefaciens]
MARNVHPLKSGVISFGSFQGGKPGGTFVGSSELRGLARWFEPEVRDTMHRRIIDISEGIAASYGATATLTFRNLYPALVNHPAETALVVKVARTVMGEDSVDPDHSQLMGSEDFAFMLEQRPGNIALLGNGSTAGLHDPAYDFNDAAIPYGVAYWTRLIEASMPLQNS